MEELKLNINGKDYPMRASLEALLIFDRLMQKKGAYYSFLRNPENAIEDIEGLLNFVIAHFKAANKDINITAEELAKELDYQNLLNITKQIFDYIGKNMPAPKEGEKKEGNIPFVPPQTQTNSGQ